MSSKPLVVAWVSDVTKALKGIGELSKGIDRTADAAERAQDAYDDQGDAAKAAAAVATKAMAALGVKSEAVADKQIAAVEEAFNALKSSGRATEGELERAFESAQRKIASINRSIGRDTETQWSKIAKSISVSLKSVDFKGISGSISRATRGAAAGAATAAAGAATAAVGIVSAALAKTQEDAFQVKVGMTASGLDADAFQRGAFAAKSQGIELDKFGDILKDVNDKLGDFRQTGGGALADFFEKIAPKVGLSLKSFDNKNSLQTLQLYVSALQRANLPAAEFAFYLEAIASDSTLLVPLLKNNGAELKRLGALGAQTGGFFSDADIRKTDQLRTSFGLLSLSFQSVGRALLQSGIADAFVKIATAATDAISRIVGQLTPENLKTDVLLSIIDDLVAIFDSREADVKNLWILEAFDSMKSFSDFVKESVIPAVKWISNFFKSLDPTIAAIVAGLLLFAPVITAIISFVGVLIGIFGGIPVAIGIALIGAAVFIYKYWDEIISWIVGSIAWLGDTIGGFFRGIVSGVFAFITDMIAFYGDAIGGFFRGIITGVIDFFAGAFDQLKADIKATVDWIASYLPDWLTGGEMSASVVPGGLAMATAGPAAAGAPVYLSFEGKQYPMTASADVAAALTRDQNFKKTTRPTAAPRTFR